MIWLNRDLIAEVGGLNLYGYVANNPINFYDPYGLYSLSEWGQIIGAGVQSWSDSANSIGQSMGGSLAYAYDKATGNSQLADNDLNTIANAYDNSPLGQTECGPNWAKEGTRLALGIGGLSVAAIAPVVALQALAYANETAAIAQLGSLAEAAQQARLAVLVAQGQLEIMADSVAADSIEWKAAMAVARITSDQAVDAEVAQLVAQGQYQRLAAATASFLGF
jgi:hypothetical protein